MTPSPATLLDVWERGAADPPYRRALRLLRAALPAEPPAELTAWDVARRDDALLRERRRLFGSRLACAADCPACGDAMELETTVDALLGAAPAAAGDPPPVAAGGFEVSYRLPTTADLLALDGRGRGGRREFLLRRCVVAARCGADEVDAAELPPEVLAAVGEAVARRAALADLRFAARCASCGHEWESVFDAGEYLWAELDRWARQVLAEVHALAAAYGWTEAEVLALSAARRRAYLELVGA